MSLQRLGARGTIGSLTDQTPNAVKVNLVWDMIFQEVLSERDWKFAKTRVQLQQNSNRPVGGYRFAYSLPSDFLRLVKPREIPQERRIADASIWGDSGFGHHHRDLPVHPHHVAPYVVEAVLSADGTSYTTNLLTHYPGCNVNYSTVCPITICYIRLIIDFTQLLPGFVNCLADRLAAELAPSVTESSKKAQERMELYRANLNSAQAQQECDDYLQDEAGSSTWIDAGRYDSWGAHR
jgi:hypothetical protein